MRTHFFYIFLLLLTVLVFRCQNDPTHLPNQTESDQRKQATLIAACESIADLIQAEVITETDEVVAAFRIETANLQTREPWLSIQQRIETQLQKAKNVKEQEKLLRAVPTKPAT